MREPLAAVGALTAAGDVKVPRCDSDWAGELRGESCACVTPEIRRDRTGEAVGAST